MNRWFLSITILLLGSMNSISAQVLPDSIRVKNDVIGYRVYQGPMQIGNNRIKLLLEDCEPAYIDYSRGKKMESFSTFFVVAGTVGALAAVGDYYLNDREQLAAELAIPAVVLVGVGIPLYASATRRSKRGIFHYNSHCLD